jgi:hypothetical protein
MVTLVVLAFAVASISFTISVTSIFGWLREAVSSIHPKLEELIFCPYCLGHYIALVVLLTTGAYDSVFTDTINNVAVRFLLIWFSVMGMVAVLHAVMLVAYKPVAETMSYRKWAKKNPNKVPKD